MESKPCLKDSGDFQRSLPEWKSIVRVLVWISLISIPLTLYSAVTVFFLQYKVDLLKMQLGVILQEQVKGNEELIQSFKNELGEILHRQLSPVRSKHSDGAGLLPAKTLKLEEELLRLSAKSILEKPIEMLGKLEKSTVPTFNDNEEETYAESDYGPTTDSGNDIYEKDDDADYYNMADSEENKLKTKREIRDYDLSSEREQKIKNNTEKANKITRTSAEREKSSTEVSSEIASKEKFLPSSYKITFGSTRKPHFHKKHWKSRYGSAEKYYIEYQSTTATPIQVRRSRTKSTESQDIDKTISLNGEKFQQHTSPHRDTITKEEAYFRGYGRKSSEESTHYVDSSRESSRERSFDAPAYNMITIHFSADTSHYSRDRDPHYFGNGRMQIKSEVYKDWKPAHWTQGVKMSKYFHLHQGRVTVSTTGIYLIYAQIQYSNVQEVNGFSVFRNKEVVVQCITTSTHPDKHEIKSNTCGISTTILLQSNDSVCIKDLHHGRYVVLTPEKSYFGLVLLSPFKN